MIFVSLFFKNRKTKVYLLENKNSSENDKGYSDFHPHPLSIGQKQIFIHKNTKVNAHIHPYTSIVL